MKTKKIAIIVGSLRKESFNRKMARALIAIAPEHLEIQIVEIDDLEMYNQDLDAKPPENWTSFRNRLQAIDGVVFFTPEYNRSIPGVLKNAIDVGSRPYGKSIWENRPAAVVSVSPGRLGGFGANHHLRQSLVFLNMPTMPQPEVYLGDVAEFFDDKSNLTDESTRELLWKFINSFDLWLDKYAFSITEEAWWNNQPTGIRGNWLAELVDV